MIILSLLMFSLQASTKGEMSYWFFSIGIIMMRVGFVLIFNALMAFVVRKFSSIPKIITENFIENYSILNFHQS